ncbi:SH3 domain-containing protein [Nostoc sp.]|uniref:SH3 domain-containing protein n=1 Tax=Nostoc sp. TaxID=1180 RepID=UPI002FF4DA85
MLNTKENLKQIEMDTIQQELLFTELTPEAAATVEGGFLYTTERVTTRLNIRERPTTKSDKIGYFLPGDVFEASAKVTNGFRKLSERAGWVSAEFTRRVLKTSAGFIKLT